MRPADRAGARSTRSPPAWRVAPDAEITLEANPTSVEAGRFRGYRAAGVNRLSLGVQALERRRAQGARPPPHRRRGDRRRWRSRAAIFPRYSFDLIYARPGQSAAAWRAELARGARAGGRASVALPAHHRARHHLRAAARRRQAGAARRGAARARCSTRRRRSPKRPACPPTRSPTTRGRAASAGTISSTGATANTPASAPARTAAW